MRRIEAVSALIALYLAIGAAEAKAQDWWFGFTYGAATPSGDTKEFAEGFSWRNVGIDGRKMLSDNLSAGFYTAWNVFDERASEAQTAGFEGIDVTGTPYTYVNAFPILATAHYYLGTPDWRGGVRAFVGAGAGAYVEEHRLDIGLSSFTDTAWHLGLSGDAGVAYKFRTPVAVYLSARYNYGFKAHDRTLSYFSFSVGAAWSR